MTRDEKILLLKSFASGKIALEELLPKELGITIDLDSTTFYIDGEVVPPDVMNKEIDKGRNDITFNVTIE